MVRGTEHWTKPRPWVTRRRLAIALAIYAVLLIASHAVQRTSGGAVLPVPRPTGVVQLPEMTADGPHESGRTIDVAYMEWRSGVADAPLVLLVHGSPGDATNFQALAPVLTGRGIDAIAVDLPGFGGSEPWVADYSARSYARTCLALLDDLRARGDVPERVHLVGWSNGGSVLLNMADITRDDPAAVDLASLTLMLATGAQRTEGSGNFYFERAKYLLGFASLVAGVEAVPHFGLLGPTSFRHAFIRSFLDTDQRPLADVLRTMDEPLLILHGRHDFLIAPWAADEHHALAPRSTLVMTDADHFMPFLRPGLAVDHIAAFVRRHEDPATPAVRSAADLAVEPALDPLYRGFDALGSWLRTRHWTLEAAVVLAFALLSWRLGLVLAAVLVAGMHVDFGVASVGLALAIAIRGPGVWRRALCLVLGILALTPAWMLVRFGGWWAVEQYGTPALLAVVLITMPMTWVLPRLWTRTNRQRLRAGIGRWAGHEFWPTWLNHVLLAPTYIRQYIRYGHPVLFTAANPGIPGAGGFVGERKSLIVRDLEAAGAPVLPVELIPAGGDADARVRYAERAIAERPELGGYPIVCKPDVGERGLAVRVCDDAAELRAHIEGVPAAIILQRFDPAPHEIGLFWVRQTPPGRPDAGGLEGEIFAITRKVFPRIEGDGVHTLRELVLDDDRFRVQEPVFARRFGRAIDLVPPRGEVVRLGLAGNHSMGCRFEDAAELITDALTHAIDRVCRQYPDADGTPGGLDIGRFDIRYADEESLMRGEGFSIVELNGSSAEATNVYDPRRTWWWAINVMSRQWAHAYRLGAMRRELGVRPVGPIELIRMSRRHQEVRDATERPETA
ncbi:MAG: alpha/beta fold hydrolase [Planctomycetota bacterium]